MNHCRITVGNTMNAKRAVLIVVGLGDKPGGSGGNGPVSCGPTQMTMKSVHADHTSAKTKVIRKRPDLTSLRARWRYTPPAIIASQRYSMGMRITLFPLLCFHSLFSALRLFNILF